MAKKAFRSYNKYLISFLVNAINSLLNINQTHQILYSENFIYKISMSISATFLWNIVCLCHICSIWPFFLTGIILTTLWVFNKENFAFGYCRILALDLKSWILNTRFQNRPTSHGRLAQHYLSTHLFFQFGFVLD